MVVATSSGRLRRVSLKRYPSGAAASPFSSWLHGRSTFPFVPSLVSAAPALRLLPLHAQAASEQEQADWQRRADEAAALAASSSSSSTSSPPPAFGEWRWTLNWDEITPNILVGSCPRSPADMDRLVEEAEVDAVLCLQCDMCFEALEIPYAAIRARGEQRGVLMTRVAVRDFDHNDQALMLPQAVRQLGTLQRLGKKVYVHCTAGINRATLTVLGYLTFVQKMELEDAHDLVRRKRSQAHPYLDCWHTIRTQLLEGRSEEIGAISRGIYEERAKNNKSVEHIEDKTSDWYAAERELIAKTFERYVDSDVQAITSATAVSTTTFQKGGGGGLTKLEKDNKKEVEGEEEEDPRELRRLLQESEARYETLKVAVSGVQSVLGNLEAEAAQQAWLQDILKEAEEKGGLSECNENEILRREEETMTNGH